LINEKIKSFLATGPARFPWIKRLSIETSHTPGWFTTHRVELQLLQAPELEIPRLELIFIDALDIRIGDVTARDGLQLAIWDISDRQLERIRYIVADQEQGETIRPQCLYFECQLVA
jgi:hypothetical protein